MIEWTALIIGLTGVALGGASLAWQYYAWQREGPSVEVRTTGGLAGYSSDEISKWVGVNAINQGRSAIQITGWGFELTDGRTLVFPMDLPGSEKLPHTLEPFHGAQWMAPLGTINESDLPSGDPVVFDGFVDLGTGKRIKGDSYKFDRAVIIEERNPLEP